jgi:hypothetical protein
MYNDNKWEVIVRVVNIGGIADHQCSNFPFIILFKMALITLLFFHLQELFNNTCHLTPHLFLSKCMFFVGMFIFFSSTRVHPRVFIGFVLLIIVVFCLFPFCVFHPMSLSMDCPFLVVPSVFFSMHLSCVQCTICCLCLWIGHSLLSLRFSLMLIYHLQSVLYA